MINVPVIDLPNPDPTMIGALDVQLAHTTVMEMESATVHVHGLWIGEIGEGRRTGKGVGQGIDMNAITIEIEVEVEIGEIEREKEKGKGKGV